jgi:hypothetical protein
MEPAVKLIKPKYNALGQPVPPGVPEGAQRPAPQAGAGEALAAAIAKSAAPKKRPPRRGQLGTPPSGFGKRIEGPSTSTTRVGY